MLYKPRYTIVLGGSQFTPYNLLVLSLCLKAKPMKNQAEFFCVARYKFTLQIWAELLKAWLALTIG